MKLILSIILTVCFCVEATAQTLRTLAYNTTNGQIVAATNVVWTNAFSFSTNTVAAQVRSNLSLGWSALTNTNATNFRAAIGLGVTAVDTLVLAEGGSVYIAGDGGELFTDNFYPGYIVVGDAGIDFETTGSIATTRANLGFSTNLNTLWTATNASNARAAAGLTLPALTNTNAANFRASIGFSTNAGWNGTFYFPDPENGNVTMAAQVINGIIVSIYEL